MHRNEALMNQSKAKNSDAEASFPGSDLKGVFSASEFLRIHALDQFADNFFDGYTVVVIGSGDIASQVAQAAKELAADEVKVNNLMPTAIKGDPDHVCSVEFEGDEGQILVLAAGAVILAMGNTRHERLIAEGWENRGPFDEPRLSDIVEMYKEDGFQVSLETFDPDLEEGCVACMRLTADMYRSVYTKK